VKRRGKWQKLFARCPGRAYLESKDFKKMVRGGLVGGIRGKVWMEASGAVSQLESNPKLYSQLIEDDDALSPEASQASEAISQIEVPCLSVR
jgi:hypothetical protein